MIHKLFDEVNRSLTAVYDRASYLDDSPLSEEVACLLEAMRRLLLKVEPMFLTPNFDNQELESILNENKEEIEKEISLRFTWRRLMRELRDAGLLDEAEALETKLHEQDWFYQTEMIDGLEVKSYKIKKLPK